MRGRKETGALIYVPDALFEQTRDTALEYADELDVLLYPLSDIREELRSLLE